MKSCFSIIAAIVLIIMSSGCANLPDTAGNGRLDIGGASVDYVEPLAQALDAYYPGAGKIVRGVGGPSAVVGPQLPAGYQVVYDVRDPEGNLVDLSAYTRIPRLVPISGAAMLPVVPDEVPVANTPEMPPKIAAAMTNLLSVLQAQAAEIEAKGGK